MADKNANKNQNAPEPTLAELEAQEAEMYASEEELQAKAELEVAAALPPAADVMVLRLREPFEFLQDGIRYKKPKLARFTSQDHDIALFHRLGAEMDVLDGNKVLCDYADIAE